MFFKAAGALDPTSLPQCTYIMTDQAESCTETAAPSVPDDAAACGAVALGAAATAGDCAAVMLAADPSARACTYAPVPDPTPASVANGENDVVLGTPTFNLMARRLEVASAGRAALRYIRLRGFTDTGSGGGAINVQSGTVAVFDCIIEDNSAGAPGGGAIIGTDSTVMVERTLFQRNSAPRGGAIALTDSTLRADGATFDLNAATEDGGAVYATMTGVSTTVAVSISYSQFWNNSAGAAFTGDAVYLSGVTRWSAVNASYVPYDALRTVETQGVTMVSCDDESYRSCVPGQGCSYGVATLYCAPCQPNLASAEGFKCQLCLPGKGPSRDQDACEQCATGLYSSHGICISCSRGKEPDPSQSECRNCANGTYSDTGTVCEMCPAGTEPHSMIGVEEVEAGWEDWAETDPHSLIGAADCIVCVGGRYKEEGWERCEQCEGGYQPTVNRTLCEECPAGRAGVNGTCELCPDGYRPNSLPQACTEGNTIANSPVECVGMTGDICEYECDFGYSVAGTHRCGLEAFEGGFCAPNDCIEGYSIEHSDVVCTGFLGEECVYTCEEGYTVTGRHVCGKNRAFTGGSCTPNTCTNETSIPHSPTTCTSRTGDVCNYVCDLGYFATGTHVCGANGALSGGACMPSSCANGLTIANSPVSCTGATGTNCLYTCNPGYAVGQPHICGADNTFRGGSCSPRRCTSGLRLPHSPTPCNGTTGDVCSYTCEPGYTVTGVHECNTAQFFAGGRCECVPTAPVSFARVLAWLTGRCLHRPNECVVGLTIPNARRTEMQADGSFTTCRGTVGSQCVYECNSGYIPQGRHECDVVTTLESCIATDGANAGHVDTCSAVDISGSDSDADRQSCEDAVVCTYTPRSDVETFSGGACVPPPPAPTPCAGEHACGANATCTLDGATQVCTCDDGMWGNGVNCSVWSDCVLRVSFEVAEPTATADRVCQNVTLTANGQFAEALPTLTRDTVIADCPPGTHQGQTQQMDCPVCPAGTVDDDFDPATECKTCSPGRFQLSQGESECTLCAWGTYDDDYSAATPCVPCESGFNSTLDRTGCRPNSCDLGRAITHSSVDCIGTTEDVCEFECDPGFTATGDHVCGSGGAFAGGWCAANVCTEESFLHRSPTTCTDGTSIQCSYDCDEGYSAAGAHVCQADGVFVGGLCTANRCTLGLTIEHSNTTCNGTTGDECDFECIDGYTETATHVCDVDGEFKGGSCAKNPPERTFCVRCREGYYGKHGLCFPCENGWQDVEPDQTECEPCPQGYAGTNGFCHQCESKWTPDLNGTVCEPCPDNFATGPIGVCWECPSGYTPNRTEVDSIGCVECPPGKAGVDGWCLSCVNGSQPNSLRSACEPCPRGGYSPNGETCLTCGPGTRPAPSGLLCESCDPGYAGFLGICEACVSGQQPHGNRSICEPCPLGYAGKNGLCLPCEPGDEPILFNTECGDCAPGRYKSTGAMAVSDASVGSSVETSATQTSFVLSYEGGNLIDGVEDGSGWAYWGGATRANPASAIFTLSQPAGVHSIRVVSGMLMGNHHVTGVALYHTNDPAPSADGDWKPMDQLAFSEPTYHGAIEENRAYDRCYVAKPITVVIQTRAYASDVMWSIDDGPTFGNGDYPDNRVITEHVDISQYTPVLGQHVFNYYDRDAPVGGWNGAYFELYAHDGTYLGGGENEVRLGVVTPGTNPVTSGGYSFTVPENLFYEPNCTGQLGISFHGVTATGIRVDVIDSDVSNKNALVNEMQVLANTNCLTCPDGTQPSANRTDCKQCPENEAGTDGICAVCPSGTKPNSDFTACIDCPAGRTGLYGFCLPCMPGTQPNEEKTECVLCTRGRYSYAGIDCLECPTGKESKARPICEPVEPCSPDGEPLTAFRFDLDEGAFGTANSTAQLWDDDSGWSFLTAMGDREGVVGRTDDSANGTAGSMVTSCLFSEPTIAIRLDFASRRKDNSSLLNISVDGVTYVQANLTGLSTAGTHGPVTTLNGATSNLPGLALGADTYTIAWNEWEVTIPSVPVGVQVDVEFIHEGGAFPSSDATVDNVVVTGGVCGNNDTWFSLGRCVCEPDDAVAAMGTIYTLQQRMQLYNNVPSLAVRDMPVGCESCPPGSIGVKGMCSECDSGSRDNATRGGCEWCPPGRAGLEGICDPCALGFEANPNRTDCIPCASGWYRDASSPVCHVCGNGTMPNDMAGFRDAASAREDHLQMVFTFQTQLGPNHFETLVARKNMYRFEAAEAREALAVADITECLPCAPGRAGAAGLCNQCASGTHPNGAALIPLEINDDIRAVQDGWWQAACDATWLFVPDEVAASYPLRPELADSQFFRAIFPAPGPGSLTGPPVWNESISSQALLSSPIWRTWCAVAKQTIWRRQMIDEQIAAANATNSTNTTDSGSWAEPPPPAAATYVVPDLYALPLAPWWDELADATVCVPCPRGSAGVGGRCEQCAPGSEPNDIRSECVSCEPGKFSVAGDRCLVCPVGMGADYLRAGCLDCPPGSVSSVGVCSECDSGSRPNATRGSCEECPPGRAGIEGICEQCEPGTEVSIHRTSCEECGAGKFKASNQDFGLDLPAQGAVIATAWILVRATTWVDTDRVRVWVEDVADPSSDPVTCSTRAEDCTFGCGVCCGACCDQRPASREVVMLDTSPSENSSALVQDSWVQLQADVTGFSSATFKVSVTMVSDVYDDDHAAKMVLLDAFSIANAHSSGVYAHTSFEEPTAAATPYSDRYCDFGGNDYMRAHQLKSHEGENPVSYSTSFVVHDHTKEVWGGTGELTGEIEQHWTGEERGFVTYCKGCSLYTVGNVGVMRAPAPNHTASEPPVDDDEPALRFTELIEYLLTLGIEMDTEDMLSLLERLEIDILAIPLSLFMRKVADEIAAHEDSQESDSGSWSGVDWSAVTAQASTPIVAPQAPYAAVHGAQYFGVENAAGTVEVHLSPVDLDQPDPMNHLTCKFCADGFGPIDRTSCARCPADYVSTIGDCELCGSGYQPNAAHSQCVTCSAGKAGVEGRCDECPPGTAPNAERTECETCPQGKHSLHGTGCSYCADGYSADPSGASCNRCPVGSFGTGGDCSVCPSGETPNLGWVLNATVGWQELDGAGFCKATGNRYELIETAEPLTWDDAWSAAAARGGLLATITSEAEQDCVAELVRRRSAWLGATSKHGWNWATGEPYCQGCDFADYTNWAESEPSSPYPAYLLMNWAGRDDPAHFADVRQDGEGSWPKYPGRWYSCGAGCPRPKSFVVEFQATDSYTCVACPWGFAGMDGTCEECPYGTEVNSDGTRCAPCAPGKYKVLNFDNVASSRVGGVATVSHASTLQRVNASVLNDGFDGDGRKTAGWSMQDATAADSRSAIVSFRQAYTVYEAQIYNRWHVTAGAVYSTLDEHPSLDSEWRPLEELAFRNRSYGNIVGHMLTSPGVDVFDLTFRPQNATGLRLDVTGVKGLFGVVNEIQVWANMQCEHCPHGFRVVPDRNDCEICPANYAGVYGLCDPCLSGQEPNAGQTECVDCPAGRAGFDGFCHGCPPGSEPNEEKTECILCTTGSYSYSGVRCTRCATGKEAVARPTCDPVEPCLANGIPKTVFRFDFDVDAFQVHTSGVDGWKYGGAMGTHRGVMQRTEDESTGGAVTTCLFSEDTSVTIKMDFMSRRQAKTASFQISIDGVTYILAELPGLDTPVTRGTVFALNGATSNKPELVLGIDTWTKTWNRDWVITLPRVLDGSAPSSMEFKHAGSGPSSSDAAVDNLIVTGGVCGSDDTWANLGRCVCEPDDEVAAMGRITDTLIAMGGDLRIGCEDCPAGYKGIRGVCTQCASGKMPSHWLGSCIDCAPGFAGIDGFCHDCGPGEEPMTGPDGPPGAMTMCRRCDAGRYKPSGFTECVPCWEGSLALESRLWCECPAGTTTIDEIPLDCDARGNSPDPIDPGREGLLMSIPIDLPVMIRCDLGCRGRPYDVTGSGPYTLDSSVCAAATHATGENGGYYEYRNLAPQSWYEASAAYYVETAATSVNASAQRGFAVRIPPRVEQTCIDHDECEVNNGGCDVLTKCTNAVPGRSCGGCPNGYAGPMPGAGWAMSGNTTCIPIPKEGDQEMLLPEVTLELLASPAVLIDGSPQRIEFEERFLTDVSEALDVKIDNVIFVGVAAAAAGRRQLQQAGHIAVAVSFTIKSEEPTKLFADLNIQLARPDSALRSGNVTQTIAPGQHVAASSLQMVCPPKFVETDPGSGACMPCPAGRQFSEEIVTSADGSWADSLVADESLPGVEHCVACSRGKYSEEGQSCVFCLPGEQANDDVEGATGCISCLGLGPRYKSHNGTFCSQCVETQVQSPDATGCMCDAGRYNTTATPTAFVCLDLHGVAVARATSSGLVCESCPRDTGGAMVPCIDCAGANASGMPMPGYWRTSDVSTTLMRCPFGERACAGGVDTKCVPPFAGIACASCVVAHTLDSGGCTPCPDEPVPDLLPSAVASIALLTLIALGCRATAVCCDAPALEQALDSSLPKAELSVVTLRQLITFLQTQALLSGLQAPFPAATSSFLAAQAALVDPGAIASWGSCWLRPNGIALPYLPAVASAFVAGLAVVVPATVWVLVFVARLLARCCRADPAAQKAATIFKKFDTDKDGHLRRVDFSRLAKRTGTAEYDDESWFEWCTMVGANPDKGLSLRAFEKLYELRGPDGMSELDFMFARLFPLPSSADGSEADEAANRRFFDACSAVATVAMYVVHPASAGSLLGFFSCEKLLDGLTVLRADRGTQCYTSHWFGVGFIVVIPALYVFCHLVPAGLALQLRGQVQDGTLLNNPRQFRRFGFLLRGYRPGKSLWELAVSGRKLALAWAVIFLEDYGVAFQAIVCIAILQASLVMHVVHHPHTTELPHRLEIASIAVTGATTLAAALHVYLRDEESAIDCPKSSVEQPICGGEGASDRFDAGLAAALVVVLDLALIGGMASLIWHKRYAQMKQAILSRVEARVGSHRSVVAKVIAERKDKRERDADTEKAEQLRRKTLTVEAASKTCNALTQRVKELKVEMPELRQEIDSIGGAVARLDSLIGASKERATAVHRQWSRGELKQKLRALAHGAGVVRESHWVALFSRYDKDNSGELEIDEFKVRANPGLL